MHSPSEIRSFKPLRLTEKAAASEHRPLFILQYSGKPLICFILSAAGYFFLHLGDICESSNSGIISMMSLLS